MTPHSGPVVGQRDNLIAISCELCGFIHLDPIPTKDWYSDGFYHRHVKPDYRKEYDEDSQWWNEIYGDWLEIAAANVEEWNLLDVGAGTGHFTTVARGRHWRAFGLEADEKLASQSKYIYASRYEDFSVEDKWNVISAHFVMEHLPDPVHFLNWARERLTDDGLLLVTIPNDFSTIQKSLEETNWVDGKVTPFYWLNGMHVNYWNGESFVWLLYANGYEVLERYGSWEPERWLMNGQIYLKDHSLGRRLHANRKHADLSMMREERLKKYLRMGQKGRGRDLTFLARKIQ